MTLKQINAANDFKVTGTPSFYIADKYFAHNNRIEGSDINNYPSEFSNVVNKLLGNKPSTCNSDTICYELQALIFHIQIIHVDCNSVLLELRQFNGLSIYRRQILFVLQGKHLPPPLSNLHSLCCNILLFACDNLRRQRIFFLHRY